MAVTLLDADQVIQHASDDANNAIRVTIAGQASGGGSTPVQVETVNSLVKVPYDYIALAYNLDNTLHTAMYYLGGSGGTLVATLTLGYDGNQNLTSVAQT